MNNLFVILLLTTITGTIFYLIGLLFGKVWFQNDIRPLRDQMRITQWAFLLPFVYGILYLRIRARVRVIDGGQINLFYNTPAVRKIWALLGLIWLLLFLVLFARKVYVRWCWMRVFQGNIPEEDEETSILFENICAQLGVKGKISLYRNDSVKMPCIAYSHGYALVLPLDCYSKKETAVILYHELCHYLNRDLYVKTVSCIVSLLHVFNPAVHILLKQLSMACEEYCDRRACLEGAGMFSEKEYFLTILHVLANEGKRERYNLFTLADTMGDYERRVQCMRRYHDHGGVKRKTAIMLAICFLIGSSAVALAIGSGLTRIYTTVTEVTDTRIEEEKIDNTDNRQELVSTDDGKMLEEQKRICDLNFVDIVMMDENVEIEGNFVNIDWSIEPGKSAMISSLNEKVGDVISVITVGNVSDIRYQMGIKTPDDILRYVEGTGHVSPDFPISTDGEYCFFITNLDNSRELNVKGTVIK